MAALERDSYTCQECGKVGCRLEVHHIVSVCYGGESTLDNVIILCVRCHKQKHWGWGGTYVMTEEERSARLAAAILGELKMLDLVGYKSVIGRKTRSCSGACGSDGRISLTFERTSLYWNRTDNRSEYHFSTPYGDFIVRLARQALLTSATVQGTFFGTSIELPDTAGQIGSTRQAEMEISR